MATYRIVLRQTAREEYFEAIKWYQEKSLAAAENFVAAVSEKFDHISNYPRQYKNIYKSYHETSLKIYPYTIVYFIEDNRQRVVIVAVYHQKRHPLKKYRK